jgi:hypothetical protein
MTIVVIPDPRQRDRESILIFDGEKWIPASAGMTLLIAAASLFLIFLCVLRVLCGGSF